jgi:hypothetical protein
LKENESIASLGHLDVGRQRKHSPVSDCHGGRLSTYTCHPRSSVSWMYPEADSVFCLHRKMHQLRPGTAFCLITSFDSKEKSGNFYLKKWPQVERRQLCK